MGTRLFLGNLPWAAVGADLEKLFRDCGVAFKSVRVVTDRDTGKSKGYAFAELADGVDSLVAKEALAGAVVGERDLHVEDAVSDGPRSGHRRGGASSRDSRPKDRGRGRRRERSDDYGWDS